MKVHSSFLVYRDFISPQIFCIDGVKFIEKQTEIEVFALKKQSQHGDYVSNLNKIDFKREMIDDSQISMENKTKDELARSKVIANNASRQEISQLANTYDEFLKIKESKDYQKQGYIYKFAKSKNSWVKVYGDIINLLLTLYYDNKKQKVVMGPFIIDGQAVLKKIQIVKEKYCLDLMFNLNDSGLFNLILGFDDSNQALEWQDLIEKIRDITKQKAMADQHSRRSSQISSIQSSQSTPNLNKSPRGSYLQQESPANIKKQATMPIEINKPKGPPSGIRQDFFSQAKEYKTLIDDVKADQDMAAFINKNDNNNKRQDLSPLPQMRKSQSQREQNIGSHYEEQKLIVKDQQSTKPVEMSFGGPQHMKFLNNQSIQSFNQDSIQVPFGSDLAKEETKIPKQKQQSQVKPKLGDRLSKRTAMNQPNKFLYERTLSPLSERGNSEEEDKYARSTMNKNKEGSVNVNVLDSKNFRGSILQQDYRQSVKDSVFSMNKESIISTDMNDGRSRRKRYNNSIISQENAQAKIIEILNTKIPEDQLKKAQRNSSLSPISNSLNKITFKKFNDPSIILTRGAQNPWDLAPIQLQLIIKLLFTKQSKDLLRIKEDTDTLVYNKNNLRVYASEDLETFQNKMEIDTQTQKQQVKNKNNILIFKSYYHLESSNIKTVMKIYDEPERLKLWDPNIQSSKIIQMLSGSSAKIYNKIKKANANSSDKNISGGTLSQELLINYQQEVKADTLFYLVEQTFNNTSGVGAKDIPKDNILLNLIIAKQKPFNKCRPCCRGSSNKAQLQNILLRQIKSHYEGMKNYSQVVKVPDQNQNLERQQSMQIQQSQRTSVKYQENQDFLKKLLDSKEPNLKIENSDRLTKKKQSSLGQQHDWDNLKLQTQERNNFDSKRLQKLGFKEDTEVNRNSQRSGQDRSSRNSQKSPTQSGLSRSPSGNNRNNAIYDQRRTSFQPIKQQSSNVEKGIDHYQKSGILQRDDLDPNKFQERRQNQRLKNQASSQQQVNQKNLEQLLLEDSQVEQDVFGKYNQRNTDLRGRNQDYDYDRVNQNMIYAEDENNSEDSSYDYDQEVRHLTLRKGEVNQFFEENDFKREPKHGLIFTNEELLKKQRGVMSHFIKQMGFNVMHGKSILQISLPIKVFDSKSFLEKIAMFMKMAPHYFEKAAAISQKDFNSSLQRFKLAVAYAVSIRQFTAQMRKPFNPILGETYEARLGNYKIGLEQISHHPPISYYNLWSTHHQDFKVYGSLEYRQVIGANSAGGHGFGPLIVEFKGGQKIEIRSPITEVSGILYGVRAFNIYDTMTIKDTKNNLFCEIVFNPDKKSGFKSLFGMGGGKSALNDDQRVDYIEGVISNRDNIDYKKNRGKLNEGTDYICLVNGHWTEDLYIDGVKYWHIDDFKGLQVRPSQNPLPSDCRFREDLVHLINTDEDTGQKWKVILEERQRYDRKLREDAKKKRQKTGKKWTHQ
ncbi:oxysterol binding family protein [Stylonychia lemnae]|uniref:Oxysterol binding family protein n=1 Tax=Stylonychia lemnae TaxID=5949 RepID=A0A078B9C4_STYLE|nr:oxysterol binding family protein [Stylonychia lemnae]|eukprot:CDW89867.1 oxysterol binding family protein [Stylonychia lemnae]